MTGTDAFAGVGSLRSCVTGFAPSLSCVEGHGWVGRSHQYDTQASRR